MKKIIFLLLTVCSVQFTFAQDAEQTQTQEQEQPLVFLFTEYDFGTIDYAGDGSVVFQFTNNGDIPAVLTSVRASCGCTTPDWPHDPIGPGESAEIKVTYDTKRTGYFNKGITVVSNVSKKPIQLKIFGTVKAQGQ